jgi:hypothetical protein
MVGLVNVPAALPPRTALVGIDPIGKGTPHCEALSSYVTRLSWAHRLTLATVIGSVAGEALADPSDLALEAVAWERHLDAGLRNASLGLAARDRASSTWVEAFGRLCGRDDLQSLTLLGWAPVLPALGLVRSAIAFCPECLAAWGGNPYEPLLWLLRPVTICVTHQARLQTACHACGAERWPLTGTATPGRCRCGARLADAPPVPIDADDESADWERWVAGEMGSLIAVSETATPDPLGVADAVARAIEVASDGNMTRFAERIGTALATVSLWRSGRRMPSIEHSLRICRATGWRLVDFLRGGPDGPDAAGAPAEAVIPGGKRPYRRVDWGAVGAALADALAEDPAPSLPTLTLRLGVKDKALRRRYPDEARRTIDRWNLRLSLQARAREAAVVERTVAATRAIHAEGLYPSAYRVKARVGSSISFKDRATKQAWRETVIALRYRDPVGRGRHYVGSATP